MTCIHGLDENNCPTYRIMKFSLPENSLKFNKLNESLKSEHLFFKLNSKENEKFINELNPNLPNLHKNSIDLISTPKILNKLPNFKNKMLSERLEEIEVSKSDIFKISEKISLASSEWKPKKEE